RGLVTRRPQYLGRLGDHTLLVVRPGRGLGGTLTDIGPSDSLATDFDPGVVNVLSGVLHKHVPRAGMNCNPGVAIGVRPLDGDDPSIDMNFGTIRQVFELDDRRRVAKKETGGAGRSRQPNHPDGPHDQATRANESERRKGVPPRPAQIFWSPIG